MFCILCFGVDLLSFGGVLGESWGVLALILPGLAVPLRRRLPVPLARAEASPSGWPRDERQQSATSRTDATERGRP